MEPLDESIELVPVYADELAYADYCLYFIKYLKLPGKPISFKRFCDTLNKGGLVKIGAYAYTLINSETK